MRSISRSFVPGGKVTEDVSKLSAASFVFSGVIIADFLRFGYLSRSSRSQETLVPHRSHRTRDIRSLNISSPSRDRWLPHPAALSCLTCRELLLTSKLWHLS